LFAISKNDSGVTVNSQHSDCNATHASLLARARIRDPEAWSELVDLYGPLIAYWGRRCGFDPHTAADCTQDVFAALARSLDTFEPRGTDGSFRAWLWTITSNKIKDRMRVEARNVQADGGSTAMRSLGELPDQFAVPDEEPTEENQISELLARGLWQIRVEFADKTWSMFQRAVLDDIATSQVADEFGVTAATVRQSKSRI
jgi:RNA polymerase sigma-70 factor (ECF subfamily)